MGAVISLSALFTILKLYKWSTYQLLSSDLFPPVTNPIIAYDIAEFFYFVLIFVFNYKCVLFSDIEFSYNLMMVCSHTETLCPLFYQ